MSDNMSTVHCTIDKTDCGCVHLYIEGYCDIKLSSDSAKMIGELLVVEAINDKK